MPDARRGNRRTIAAEVLLRRSGELSYTVNAFDLSENGCKIEFVERPQLGEIVWVKFTGLDSLESTVRWTKGFEVGLQFNRPMDERVLLNLLPRLA